MDLKCIYNNLTLEPNRPDNPVFDPKDKWAKWSWHRPRTAPTRTHGPRPAPSERRLGSKSADRFKPRCTAAASPLHHSTLCLDSTASLHPWRSSAVSPRAHCLVSAESSNPQQWSAFVAQSVFFLCSISSSLPPFYRLSHDEAPHRLRLHLLHDSRRRRHQQVADVLRVAAVTSARAVTASPEAPESSQPSRSGGTTKQKWWILDFLQVWSFILWMFTL